MTVSYERLLPADGPGAVEGTPRSFRFSPQVPRSPIRDVHTALPLQHESIGVEDGGGSEGDYHATEFMVRTRFGFLPPGPP
jgi:hypothetical protein